MPLVDGGQRGRDDLGDVEVVISDDGHILGDAEARLLELEDEAGGPDIAGGNESVGPALAVQVFDALIQHIRGRGDVLKVRIPDEAFDAVFMRGDALLEGLLAQHHQLVVGRV